MGCIFCSSPHPFPATPLHPRRPQPSAHFSAPISRPQPSAQPSSLIPSGFFSPPISSHSVAPTPSAAVREILPTHFPSAPVRAATLYLLQRLRLPTHFQPLPRTHAVRNRPRSSPHPFPVRSRQRSQARSSPAASSLSSHSVAPMLSAAVRALLRTHCPSAAVRAAQGRASPAASSPHPFPATAWHLRHPQPSAHFSAPIARPQPSAKRSSLITSGFFSPPISSHSLAPTQSAAIRALLRTHFPSAAVRVAKLAHHNRFFPQPLPCTHAVPQPICRPQPSAQPSSLITSGCFSPPISSHSLAPTPSAAVHAVLRTHFPSAAVRAAKLAHHQRLLLPTHFQPLPCTHAVRRCPQPSAHFSALIARLQPSAQPSSLITSGFFSLPIQPLPCTHAVRSRPLHSFPFLSLLSLPFSFLSHPFPSFPVLSLPFPSCSFLSHPFPSFPILSFLSLPFPCTHAVRTPPFKPARSPTRLNN